MKKIFLTALLGLLTLSALPQEGYFFFADKAGGKDARGAARDHKFETAQMVFDSLVDGQGDFRRKRPRLVMKNSERYVAWAQPEKAEIGLEELAYDVCASFGPDSLNALAALLTHELVHYYERHEWSRHFAQENQELSTAQKLKQLEEGLKLEAQADYLGGFTAYSVGFDVHGIMPQLLRKIYSEEAYDLPEEIDGYPSMQDRIAMSESAMKRLAELQVVFETGTYLNLLEQYDAAGDYYQYILRDFQSRDIYNNAGATALLSAIPYFSKKEMPYGLPVELDPKSRLQQRTTRDSDLDRKREREQRIEQALEYFDRAIRLDKHYGPAYLNTAAAYVLLQEWEDANYWLRQAKKKNRKKKMSADIFVLQGIIAAQQEDAEGARDWWQRARELNSQLAAVNLEILETGPLQALAGTFGFLSKKEQIEDLVLEEYLEQTMPDQMVKIDDRTICGLHRRPESRIYSHSVDFGQEYFSFQIVDGTFTGKSMEGIQIGDSAEALFEKYDKPERQVETPEGTFYIYPARNMFFEVDSQTGVKGWGIYRTNVTK